LWRIRQRFWRRIGGFITRCRRAGDVRRRPGLEGDNIWIAGDAEIKIAGARHKTGVIGLNGAGVDCSFLRLAGQQGRGGRSQTGVGSPRLDPERDLYLLRRSR